MLQRERYSGRMPAGAKSVHQKSKCDISDSKNGSYTCDTCDSKSVTVDGCRREHKLCIRKAHVTYVTSKMYHTHVTACETCDSKSVSVDGCRREQEM